MEEKARDYLSDSQRLLSNSSDSYQAASQRLLSNSSDSYQRDYQSTSQPPQSSSGGATTTMAVPKDRFYVVYLIFYVLGLGTLLPWNFFITANDYWMYKLRNDVIPVTYTPPNASQFMYNTTEISPQTTPDPHSSNRLQSLFQNSLSLCAMLPSMVFQFLNTLLQERVAERVRMIVSLIIIAIIFIITTILVPVDVSSWQEAFFALTMVCVVIINSSVAVFQSSLFGMASKLPSLYIQALMAGQGMGGVFAAVARIVSLAISPGPVSSALAYFITAVAVVFIIALCYLHLSRNSFYTFHCNVDERKRRSSIDLHGNNKFLPDRRQDDDQSDDVWRKDDARPINETDFLGKVDVKKASPPFRAIFKKIWVHCFCIFFVFFITLACFPSITASVQSISQNKTWSEVYFIPVACFLLFNLTDWIGRTAAGYIHIPSHSRVGLLVVCVIIRGVFPALFGLCNAQPRHSSVLFTDDVYFIIFMVLFGSSNGYLSTLVMQYGPKRVDLDHAPTAGSMMAFFLAVGLAAGAGFSFVIKLAI